MFSLKKFNREIELVKKSSGPLLLQLHPRLLAVKQKVFSAIAGRAESSRYFWTAGRERFARYLGAVLLCLSIVAGPAFASTNSLPGDPLYPVKIAREQLALKLAVTENSKAKLQLKFAQNRLEELKRLSEKDEDQDADDANIPAATNSPASLSGSTEFIAGALPAPTSTTSYPANPSALRMPPVLKPRQRQLEIQTKNSAELQVNEALKNLASLKTNLEINGDSKGAESLQQGILNLKKQAALENVKIEIGQKR